MARHGGLRLATSLVMVILSARSRAALLVTLQGETSQRKLAKPVSRRRFPTQRFADKPIVAALSDEIADLAETGKSTLLLITQLGRRLLSAGLPPRYVSRALRELRDHRLDLGDQDADRLGDHEQLAQHFVFEYRRSRWIGRRPFIGYTVLPVVSLFVAWNVYFAVTLLPVILMHPEMGDYDWTAHTMYETHPLVVLVLSAIYFGGKVIPFAAATWMFFRLSKNSGRGIGWMLFATAIFSFVGFFGIRSAMSIPISPGSEGMHFALEIGDLEEQIFHYGEQLAQGLAPILVALALIARSRRHGAFELESVRMNSDRLDAAGGAEAL